MPLALFPIRCFNEIVEGFTDFLSLFRLFGEKPFTICSIIRLFVVELQAYGKLDLLDIDVVNKTDKVKIKCLMR